MVGQAPPYAPPSCKGKALFQLPLDAEHDVARFAVEVAPAVRADAVVFVVAFVGEVVDGDADVEVFGRFVLHVGVPEGVAAVFHVPAAAGAALRAHAEADRPFFGRPRQAVAGVEAQHMFRRLFVEAAAFFDAADAGGVFARVVAVAREHLPGIGQFAADFGVHAVAFQRHRLEVEAFAAVIEALAAVDGGVFLVDLVEGDGGVQVAVVPFAFPADFDVVAQCRREVAAGFADVAVVFEDAGVAGVEAVVRVKVVGDAKVRHEAAFAGVGDAVGAAVGFAVAQVVMPAPVAFPVGVARAGEEVQVVGRVDAQAAADAVGGVVVVAAVAVVGVRPVRARDFVATPGIDVVFGVARVHRHSAHVGFFAVVAVGEEEVVGCGRGR